MIGKDETLRWQMRILWPEVEGTDEARAFWSAQPEGAIFDAAWEIACAEYRRKHGKDPVFDRSVTKLRRLGDPSDD